MPLKIYWHSPRRASMQTDESQTSKQNTPDEAAVNGVAADPRYSRSTIGFPYTPLKDAELIAKQLHDEYGGKASPEQLAASLSASAKSGAFRIKIATARSFGAISVSRESLNLTPLGRRLIDPQTAAAARVEAFMTVPLFAALTEQYKGVMLPPDAGLERKIHDLGVSSRQTAKARQAFQRSAELAGFFKHGKQRLVPPANAPSSDLRQENVGIRTGSRGRRPTAPSSREPWSICGSCFWTKASHGRRTKSRSSWKLRANCVRCSQQTVRGQRAWSKPNPSLQSVQRRARRTSTSSSRRHGRQGGAVSSVRATTSSVPLPTGIRDQWSSSAPPAKVAISRTFVQLLSVLGWN